MTDRIGKFIRAIPTRAFSEPILTLVIAFIISRMGIYLFKPFLVNPINYYWQYLDPVILKDDLWRGLYYLHSQPPLFNLYLGLVLKIIPPVYVPQAFSFMYFFMGLGIILSTYYLMRCLEVPVIIALIISLVFLFSPALIKAERWLFYTYPLTLAVTVAAVTLYKFSKESRPIYFLLTALIITSIVLTRSFFHVIFWMIPILTMIFFFEIDRHRKNLRFLAGVSIFFLLLAGSTYLKNYLMFGVFTSSTWQGMNLAGMTSYVKKSDVDKLVASGEITPLSRIGRFSNPEIYYAYYHFPPPTGIDLLDNFSKSTGAVNWNNIIYPRTALEYQKNSITLIKKYPLDYLKAVFNEIYIFFGLEYYHVFYEYPEWKITGKDQSSYKILKSFATIYVLPPLGAGLFFITVAFMVREIIVRYKMRQEKENRPIFLLYSFLKFNIIYVFAVANFMELGEGCFMRIPIDPFLAVGFAKFFHLTFQRLSYRILPINRFVL